MNLAGNLVSMMIATKLIVTFYKDDFQQVFVFVTNLKLGNKKAKHYKFDFY